MKKELVKKEKEIRLEKELKKNLKRRKVQAKKRSFFELLLMRFTPKNIWSFQVNFF